MKGKVIAAFLVIVSAALCFSFGVRASAFEVTRGPHTDATVFAPGVYDLSVGTDAEEPTYRWYVRVGKGSSASSYLPLDDNDRYQGVHTAHLRLVTHDGLAATYDGNGWDGLYFSCLVTDKYGNQKFGPDLNMTVFTHQSLLDKLERDGVRFTETGIAYDGGGSPDFVGETGGVRYYDTFFDKGLLPYCRFVPVDKELKSTSEVEVFAETFITADGKTVKYDSSANGFLPKKYGSGAVTIRHDLVLYVNGQRMETIDSKTAVVNVKVPDPIGYAYTKTNAAVLDGQYSQAPVLTRLSAKTCVSLIREEGGYYRVAAGGFLGYLPKTALDVPERITVVGLMNVPEPSSYVKAGTQVSFADNRRYGLFQTDPVTWYDVTAGRIVKENEVFLTNHMYRLSVWVSAKPGFNFALSGGDPNVSASVNLKEAVAHRAYEQDPSEVIEIVYTFEHVHDLKKVTQKNPTCTVPGKLTYYRCSCGAEYEDYEGKTRITDPDWGIIPAPGHRESAWKSDGTYHYKFCLRRECGEEIPGTRAIHAGGTATCTSGAVCSVCLLTYGPTGAHRWSSEWISAGEAGHQHACLNLCGQLSPVEAHVPGPAATVEAPERCLKCGYVLAEALEKPDETESSSETETSSDPESSSDSPESTETETMNEPESEKEPSDQESSVNAPSEPETSHPEAEGLPPLILGLLIGAGIVLLVAILLIVLLIAGKKKKQ